MQKNKTSHSANDYSHSGNDNHLFENMELSLAVIDRKGLIVKFNSAFLNIINYNTEELKGKNYFDLLPKLNRNNEIALFKSILNSKKSKSIEKMIISGSGEQIKVRQNISAINYNEQLYVLIHFEKIINEKISIKTLSESESSYKLIFERAADAIFISDLKGNFVDVNQTACKTLGYTKRELLAMNVIDVDPEFDDFTKLMNFWETHTPGKSIILETRHKKKNGEIFPVEVNIEIIKYEDTEFVIGFARNTTERKKAEELLQISKFTLDHASMPITWVNKAGTITYANHVSTKFFGKNIDQIKGEKVWKIYPNSNSKTWKKHWEKLVKTGFVLNHSTYDLNEKKSFIDIHSFYIKTSEVEYSVNISIDVTEQKEIEEALTESEERFKLAFFTSPDSININSIYDGTYIEVNKGFSEITGYTREEVIGKSSLALNIWADPKDRDKLVKGLTEDGFVKNLEAKFITKNGKIIDGLMSATIIKWKGKPHVINISREITSLKETERQLRENEARFRSIFENNHAVMLIVDPNNGKIINANPAAIKFYGYSRETFIDNLRVHQLNVMSTKQVNRNLNYVQKSIKEFFQVKHQLANGEIKDVEVYSGKININDRILLFSIIHDITDRVRAEEEIMKLSLAIKQSPVLVVITDTEGSIEYVNPKFENVTGYRLEEVRGQNPRILKSGHTSIETYKELWNTIKSGKTWKGEFYNKKKNGDFYWESVSISPIFNSNNELTHFLAVKEDITESKNYEAQLITAKELAEKSEKLKTEFLAQMSHEIRSPINVILSFANLLQTEIKPQDTEFSELVFSSINSAGRRIIRTIDLILNMSEIQTGTYVPNIKPINLIDKIIKPLIDEFKLIAEERGLKLKLSIPREPIKLKADEYSLGQICSNLIDNAVKYTPSGFIKIKCGKIKQGPYIEISDSGIGISKKYLPELFGAFTQEEQGYSRKFEGNGLGLALVKKYCELNNAAISVKSEKGKGTSFRVQFKN